MMMDDGTNNKDGEINTKAQDLIQLDDFGWNLFEV